MREAEFGAPLIKRYLGGARPNLADPFADYQLFCERAIDVLEDVLDAFWEHPFAFAVFVHPRYTDYMTDLFAGRIYERQPSPALHTFRKLLKREGMREQSYELEDLYSIPIGSRYHPERAAIWEPKSEIESTELWMGAR